MCLLLCVVFASAYVLLHGLNDPSRSRYKLILNCIMIITSVVPPELPMELSLAVNTSLLELVRQSIFCTEPFRIPLAGSVQVCAFDKTGTITSDNFVVDGVAGLQHDDQLPSVENDVHTRHTHTYIHILLLPVIILSSFLLHC